MRTQNLKGVYFNLFGWVKHQHFKMYYRSEVKTVNKQIWKKYMNSIFNSAVNNYNIIQTVQTIIRMSTESRTLIGTTSM